jgi:L-threonylcarbamoyladenylate synthase
MAARCVPGWRLRRNCGKRRFVHTSDDIARAVRVLREGGLVALPTETVYGLGADARNELAVRRIFAVKGRPSTHPLIVHVASFEDARAWVAEVPQVAERLAAAFWPGPLTLVMRRSPLASDAVTGGQDTVALRVPAHGVALRLLRAFGGGIAAPSANRFGEVSPTCAAHVREALGNDVDLVLDAGPCQVGVESTIVDVTREPLRLLRPGGTSREALEAVLGQSVALATAAPDVRAPGMLESHYAPRAGLWLVDAPHLAVDAARRLALGARVVVIAPQRVPAPPGVIRLDVPEDAEGFARVLYARLREADRLGDVILAVPPPDSGLGLAVRDRLTRAAAPRR